MHAASGHALDDFSFLGHNHKTLILILGVTEEPSAVTEEELLDKIEEFKNEGCKLFE